MDNIYTIIESKEDFKKHFEKILKNPPKTIFFDCEGDHLSKIGKLCVLQIGIFSEEKPKVFLFDAIKYKESITELKPLLESEKVLKVIHDVKRDSEALYWQFGIQVKNIFDTQIAHYHLQLEEKKPYNNFISFVHLLEKLCNIDYSKKNSLPHVEFQDSTDWLKRPLAEFLIESAVNDVIYQKPLFDYFQKTFNDSNFINTIKMSNLWAQSYYEHKNLATSSSKVTFIDYYQDPFTLRVIKCPCPEIMSKIIGKEGKNITELKENYADKSLIYTAGKGGPKDYIFIISKEKDSLDEIMTKIPTFVMESLVTRNQASKILSRVLKLQKETNTNCIIYMNEFQKIGNEEYHKMLIMGQEKNVQKAIEIISTF